jgi:uncharacterized protein (DUF58 family)
MEPQGPRARDLSVERTLPPRLSLASEQGVRLKVTNRSRFRILLDLRDAVPPALQLLSRVEPFPLDPGRTPEVCYRVRAVQRGEARFFRVYCHLQQGLGLLSRRFTLKVESESRV